MEGAKKLRKSATNPLKSLARVHSCAAALDLPGGPLSARKRRKAPGLD
jgi:hypothetical protein